MNRKHDPQQKPNGDEADDLKTEVLMIRVFVSDRKRFRKYQRQNGIVASKAFQQLLSTLPALQEE